MRKNLYNWSGYIDVINAIDLLKSKKIVNKVLHGHPSPVFWNHEISFDEFMLKRQKEVTGKPKQLVLYIALPFCLKTNPPNCGYCLFPHVDYTGKQELKKYLRYLKREGDIYRHYLKHDQVSAIYFGGGTPNIYDEDSYGEIMNILAGQFPELNRNIEITFEGIPCLFTRNKLISLKKMGVTRISIGVQQLNPGLIKLSGRKQNPDQVLKIINWCHELNLKISADMIYGWPKLTVDSFLNDLNKLSNAEISHITNYELNLGGRTDFSRNRRHELPCNEENLFMFLSCKNYLENNGYHQVSTHDFARIAEDESNIFRFEEYMRKLWCTDGEFSGYDMWGWGFSGISYFTGTPDNPGSVFMNTNNLNDYYLSIDMNKAPIKRVFCYHREDVRLGWIFQSLQSLSVYRDTYSQLFGSEVFDDHKPIWQALEKLGWVEITHEKINLVQAGIYYTSLIQSLLSANRIDEIRQEQKQK